MLVLVVLASGASACAGWLTLPAPSDSPAASQTAFTVLDEVIRSTNRRVNSIEHIIIPRLEDTVKFIMSCVACPCPPPARSLSRAHADVLPSCRPPSLSLLRLAHPVAPRSELDEMDREDFFRLKKVQGKKKEKAAVADALAREKQAAEDDEAKAARERRHREADEDEGGADIMGGKDEDVIF